MTRIRLNYMHFNVCNIIFMFLHHKCHCTQGANTLTHADFKSHGGG